MNRVPIAPLKIIACLACLAPFVWLLLRAFAIGPLDLGANPVEAVLPTLGKSGLNILLITLTITPLRRFTGLHWLVAWRRMLGLFSFAYLSLHFLTYITLDWGFAWNSLIVDIIARPYITVGFTGLVLMLPLAVTSTNRMQRRLGRKWVKLHRLIYVIAPLGVLHFYWQGIRDPFEPLVYVGIVTLLLGLRILYWAGKQRMIRKS